MIKKCTRVEFEYGLYGVDERIKIQRIKIQLNESLIFFIHNGNRPAMNQCTFNRINQILN